LIFEPITYAEEVVLMPTDDAVVEMDSTGMVIKLDKNSY
jgi:hypothetical protein